MRSTSPQSNLLQIRGRSTCEKSSPKINKNPQMDPRKNWVPQLTWRSDRSRSIKPCDCTKQLPSSIRVYGHIRSVRLFPGYWTLTQRKNREKFVLQVRNISESVHTTHGNAMEPSHTSWISGEIKSKVTQMYHHRKRRKDPKLTISKNMRTSKTRWMPRSGKSSL